MTLDITARLGLEKDIDGVLKKPGYYIQRIGDMLLILGIEPTLDTMISYYIGYLYGKTTSYYKIKHGRALSNEEIISFNELMERRGKEIREVFYKTRYI